MREWARKFIVKNGPLAALIFSLTSIGLVPTAWAQDANCTGFDDISPGADLKLGQINSSNPRINFVKSRSTQRECPGASATCREKAYLVTGDTVIVSATNGTFLCASYVNAKGLVRAGWLPASAVTLQESRPETRLQDWIGTWTGNPEQEITIKKGKEDGQIVITGEATFGALDPERVQRGAINSGSLEAQAIPSDGFAAFTASDEGAMVFYDDGDEFDCRARLMLLGPYLLAEDNNKCGGLNVSFSGAYRHKK
jgi:hypothetical protein